MIPLEQEFGWSRPEVALAVSINIFLYGLCGPFAAALMEKFGMRRVILVALLLIAGATALTTQMRGLAAVPAVGPGDRARHRSDRKRAGRNDRESLVCGTARLGGGPADCQ
jgi:MFS family permease